MSRTFSNRVKVSSRGTNVARNQTRPRIGPSRVAARNMPATIIRREKLTDGTQIAIAQVNDLYVCARFDAYENPLGPPVKFTGGHGRTAAHAWADKTVRVIRGF